MNRDFASSDTRYGFQPGETPQNNVVCYLERNAARFADRPALRWVPPADLPAWDGSVRAKMPHQAISYGDFVSGIRSVSKGLSDLGIAKGDRVIIFLPMSVLMYTALFAVQRLGAIAVFLDSWARRSHLGASAECVAPKAMISHRMAFELIHNVPGFGRMPMRIIAGPGQGAYTARLEELLRTEGEAPIAAVASETTALITFTTGSSGVPKGANRTHRFLAAQHEALSQVVRYGEEDVDMPAFPIFSLNNLASGVTTILPAVDLAAPSDRDAAALVNQVRNERITCATLSPSMVRSVSAFCRAQGVPLESLRRVVTGGAPISRDDVRAFREVAPRAEIWILYGSTEVEPMAHIEAREMLSLASNPDPDIAERGVNVGHVSEGLRYKFIRIVKGPVTLGAQGWAELELEPGEIGEFIVTGDHVCRDYYNNKDAFRRAKIVDADGSVWHRTGDLARMDGQGYLWVVGRIHNAIERAGRYCFPVQAEVLLRRVPGVSRGAFLGMPDAELGERTAAAVEVSDAGTAPAGIVAEVRRLFAKNDIPLDSLYIVDAVPMDPRHHSKVEYRELQQQILDGRLEDQLGHA